MTDDLLAFSHQMDTYWKWESFKGGPRDIPGIQAIYAGRSSRFYNQILSDRRCRTVLDASCGPGYKTVLLAHLGYQVHGSDISAFAVQKAADLAACLGFNIAFAQAAWQDLARVIPARFDSIVVDALAWVPTREQLAAAAAEFAKVLNPSGCVIFEGADQWDDPATRPQRMQEFLQRRLQQEPRVRLAGPYYRDDTRMTEIITRNAQPDGVELVHAYVIEDPQGTRLETAEMIELCRWSWPDFQSVFRAAGFGDLHSRRLTLDGKERIYNVAVL